MHQRSTLQPVSAPSDDEINIQSLDFLFDLNAVEVFVDEDYGFTVSEGNYKSVQLQDTIVACRLNLQDTEGYRSTRLLEP